MRRTPAAKSVSERLRTAEAQLKRALADLSFGGGESAGPGCEAALVAATAELQAFAAWCAEHSPATEERAGLRMQVKNLAFLAQQVDRLLVRAAEFYRGWYLAALPAVSDDESSGYGAGPWSERARTGLLAVVC